MLATDSLAKRQRELNFRVNKAVLDKVNFNEAMKQSEECDVDKFFKIDLASKYKNIDYIVQVLKSGDSLYISRALKCDWIYNDVHSDILNPDYINDNIFPFMSLKMKNKMLKAISKHITEENLLNKFYEYCKATYYNNISMKLILKMSETSKLEIIEKNKDIFEGVSERYIISFVEDSFVLADAVINVKHEDERINYLLKFRYLYNVSHAKYLTLLEKYFNSRKYKNHCLGLRVSKNIMKKHKNRILNNPLLYVNLISKYVFAKYTTAEEAKKYLHALLPENCTSFWSDNVYAHYEHIIEKISTEERFEFLKKLFITKYPEHPFDMAKEFYSLEYYKFMSVEEKNAWAIRHLTSPNEILEVGENYNWYRFLKFDQSLTQIKKLILTTPDSDQRAKIVNVLVDSARNQSELETLFLYYTERHTNEFTYNREAFLSNVIVKHNVFDFEENCWTAFNKLLYRNEVYSLSNNSSCNDNKLRPLALVYHIIHDKEIPDTIQQYIGSTLRLSMLTEHLNILSKEQKEIVYCYLTRYFLDQLNFYDSQPYTNKLRDEVRPYIQFILELKEYFKRSDVRLEVVTKYMKADPETFFPVKNKELTLTQSELKRLLKINAAAVVDELPLVKYNIRHNASFNLRHLLSKLKIYFFNDIAIKFLNFFQKLLSEPNVNERLIYTSVYGIFVLASNKTKCNFVDKHAPSIHKIEYNEIDRNLLYIQQAICRFACFSRPPVPLSIMNNFIKGDYAQYCKPMFDSYLTNLPLPLGIQFSKSLLHKPPSLQKHGLRLAFKLIDVENLKKLVLIVWSKTKDVNTRKVIYTSLFKEMHKDIQTQLELFEVLMKITLEIKENDHKSVIKLLTNCTRLPDHLVGRYLEASWNIVSKFSDDTVNRERKINVIEKMNKNIDFMEKKIVERIVQKHVQLSLKQISPATERNEGSLSDAKWQLTESYILKFYGEKTTQDLVTFIIMKCLKKWYEVRNGDGNSREVFLFQKLCFSFITNLVRRDVEAEHYQNNCLFEIILNELKSSLPLHEIYLLVWEIRLRMITNIVVNNGILEDKIFEDETQIITHNIVVNFASELNSLLKEFIDKDMFHSFLTESIAALIDENLKRILYFIECKMMPDSLGKRQRDLNEKVREAASKKVIFEDVEKQPEESDVDKLFKIDLASRYMNIDYIVHVLRSGDSLYISRALKCDWIYYDEYDKIVNPEFLHDNVFLSMSRKMISKTLKTISTHLKNDDRISSFYEYCKAMYYDIISIKFIIIMSDAAKLKIIENDIEILNNLKVDDYQFFFGNSFVLADAFLNAVSESQRLTCIHELRYLYSVSSEEYLDLLEYYYAMDALNVRYNSLELLEKHNRDQSSLRRVNDLDKFYLKYDSRSRNWRYNGTCLGLRASKDLLIKHKHRAINNPVLYVNLISKRVLARYTTIDEAKKYLSDLLPEESSVFWGINFCKVYKHIFNLIPSEEQFKFIEEIFSVKYPAVSFSMTHKFYTLEYYKYMTMEERERWALRHVARKNEILGVGEDYRWYQFVNFELAFVEIEKLIQTTSDSNKRENMVNVLIDSTRNHNELEILLNYYYERHINDIRPKRINFLNNVIRTHDVFDFENKCWTAFNKLLYRNEVYNILNKSYRNEHTYRAIALIYHIIHYKDMPESLLHYLDYVEFYVLRDYLDQLREDRRDTVHQFTLQHFVNKLYDFEKQPYSEEIQKTARRIIWFILELLKYFKNSDEPPEIVTKYMKADCETFFPVKIEDKHLEEGQLLRFLKEDANQLVQKLPKVKYSLRSEFGLHLYRLVKKLKTYFYNDIGKKYLELFMELLAEPDVLTYGAKYDSVYGLINIPIHGMFTLADSKLICDFIRKYAPASPKIDRSNMNESLLYIQVAVCQYVSGCRPPVPLSYMRNYIDGDYVHYCISMFDTYSSSLPPLLLNELIVFLINKPVSIKKHGLRLAFKSFTVDNLTKLILEEWRKTRNVSIRMTIYTYLFKEISRRRKPAQIELFRVLDSLTLDLDHLDHEFVIHLFTNNSKLPDFIRGPYLETVSESVYRFPDNSVNKERKTNVINHIKKNIMIMNKDYLRNMMLNYVHIMITEEKVQVFEEYCLDPVNKATGELMVSYIVNYSVEEAAQSLVKIVQEKCFKMWNELCYDSKTSCGSYIIRKFYFTFVSDIINYHNDVETEAQTQINPILEGILSDLQIFLPLHEIYMLVWELRLKIISNKIIEAGIAELIANDDEDEMETMIIQKVASNFATEVHSLVKEFVDRNIYFPTLSTGIAKCLIGNLKKFVKLSKVFKSLKITNKDFFLNVCVALNSFQMLETCLLCVYVLQAGKANKKYKQLIGSLKAMNNSKVNCLLYMRYQHYGFSLTDI